ncbi:MAG: DNA replication/repair protein RecF [Ruminococcus sp.]|jgi:DNA replication and repair protein RecF|nr:DNA replication/repair protein RecF [Ruminococcus sp.]
MIIKTITADGFKNLKSVDIELSPGLNLFVGENAQGKTNLLELLWVMTGVRSFRGASDKNFLGFDRDCIKTLITYRDFERDCILTYDSKKGEKLITVNGVQVPRLSKLFGNLRAVIFTPDDLSLVSSEPSLRRAFLDLSISQIKPGYAAVLHRYNKILAQRNAALKIQSRTDIWDEQLIKTGTHISIYRKTYVEILSRYAKKIYGEISGERETLNIEYSSNVFKNFEYSHEHYKNRLSSHSEAEFRLGTTLVGIHRDDLNLTLDGLSVRDFASQGQKRSSALALKLSQAKILAAETGDAPVILLDDVLSELDSRRKNFLLRDLEGFQTLITSCERAVAGKTFTVKDGYIYA